MIDSDCLVIFRSLYFLNALQSDDDDDDDDDDNNNNNNDDDRVNVLGHKYVLGPSQNSF